MSTQTFAHFNEFYEFYIGEPQNLICRRLHVIGSTIGVLCVLMALFQSNAWWVLLGLIQGYAFAWGGIFILSTISPRHFSTLGIVFLGIGVCGGRPSHNNGLFDKSERYVS